MVNEAWSIVSTSKWFHKVACDSSTAESHSAPQKQHSWDKSCLGFTSAPPRGVWNPESPTPACWGTLLQKNFCSGKVWAAQTHPEVHTKLLTVLQTTLTNHDSTALNSGSISTQNDACWSQRSSESHHDCNCLRGSVWGARQPLQQRSLANSTICLQEPRIGARWAPSLLPGIPCSFLQTYSCLCCHKVSAEWEPGFGNMQPRFALSRAHEAPWNVQHSAAAPVVTVEPAALQNPGLYPCMCLAGNRD